MLRVSRLPSSALPEFLSEPSLIPSPALLRPPALLVALVGTFVFALRQRALFTGPYRVLEETITWEFLDPQGKEAKLTKRQDVCFNYLAITHLELATGDGDLFADFSCNYGSVVKDEDLPIADEDGVLSIANEKGVLVLFDTQKARNERFTLESTRTVRNGFKDPQQWILHQAAVPSKKTALIIMFPDNHTVKNVRISGPGGYGDRPAKKGELTQEGSRTDPPSQVSGLPGWPVGQGSLELGRVARRSVRQVAAEPRAGSPAGRVNEAPSGDPTRVASVAL